MSAHSDAIEYIDYMLPIWKSNARRYGLTKDQTEKYLAEMIHDAYRRCTEAREVR